MRLLAAALPRLVRLVPSGKLLVWLSVGVLVTALELVGRLTLRDVHDGLAASVMLAAGALYVARSKQRTWPGSAFARRQLSQLVEHLKANYGVDLRGTPPIPSRLPSGAVLALLALASWTGLAASAWWLFPEGWRELGVRTSYVAYLIVLTALWGSLLAIMMAALFSTAFLMDKQFHGGGVKSHERRSFELLLLIAYLAGVIALAQLVPVVAVLILCAGVAGAALLVASWSSGDEQAILWRSRPGRPVYSVPQRRILAGLCAVVALFVGNLLLTACGGRLFSMPDKADPMLMTNLVGTTTAWMLPGFVLVAGFTLWNVRRIDPAVRTPLTVHVTSAMGHVTTELARKGLKAHGWSVRPPGEAKQPTDIGVALVPAAQSEAFEFDPGWPLKVSAAELADPRVRDRLARRDEINLRRHAYRGMRKVFKRAFAQPKRKGGYYRFAPHWWMAGYLVYDEPQRRAADSLPTSRRVGPWYASAFRPRVRQHFHAVLRAVQIDEIIVDDGVPYRAVERVMRALFELYDKHAGGRRAEDHLFRAVPKIRTMIHECEPESPLRLRRKPGYDEPQFEELSRARILHIFKDDGDHEALVGSPFDTSWEPSPTGYLG